MDFCSKWGDRTKVSYSEIILNFVRISIMKIALIHSHLNDRGGSQRYVIEIARNLIKIGVVVDIYCYEYNKNSCYPELTKKLKINKVYTREVANNIDGFVKQKKIIKKVIQNISNIKIFKKIINMFGIDYLYSIYSTKKNATKVSNLILNSNISYDLVFAHEEPLSVYAAINYKKNKAMPIYWFCYDTIEKWFLEWKDEHKRYISRKFLLQNIYFKYDRYLINKYVDKAAVLDNGMLKRYKRLYNKEPLVRRGGVPLALFKLDRKNIFRERYNLTEETVIIFSLTRFVSYKRVHDILAMYEQLPIEVQSKVFIYLNSPVTDQSYYDWCRNKYQKTLESENIVVDTDFPSSDLEMYDMYLSSDIFIFPNENQTWGHAPLEAMGCGVATIVSTGCGISEVLKTISSEMVYEVGNIDVLSYRISELVKSKSFKGIADEQKQYIKDNLTWKKICEIYLDDISDLLGENNV